MITYPSLRGYNCSGTEISQLHMAPSIYLKNKSTKFWLFHQSAQAYTNNYASIQTKMFSGFRSLKGQKTDISLRTSRNQIPTI